MSHKLTYEELSSKAEMLADELNNAYDTIERLNSKLEMFKKVNDCKNSQIHGLKMMLKRADQIKSEAAEEVFKRLDSLKKCRSCMMTSEYEPSVTMEEIKMVLQEMKG